MSTLPEKLFAASNGRPNARHGGMSKRLLRLFLQCRALWFFHAMKEHDRTTTKRIQDNRLRVSLLKNTKILIPVHILSQEVSPQFLLVSQTNELRVGKKENGESFSTFSVSVPRPGIEPGWVAPLVFETSASTDSAIWAIA